MIGFEQIVSDVGYYYMVMDICNAYWIVVVYYGVQICCHIHS